VIMAKLHTTNSSGEMGPNLLDPRKSVARGEQTISIYVAAFSAISVTIGAGMVSLPKTALESGIPFALAYNVLNSILSIYSIHLLLESARVTGIYSMPRLTYECFGHSSLYFINIVQFIAFGIAPIAYFIIFSGILSSFLQEIPSLNNSGWSFLTQEWFSVLVLAVLIFPLIIKKSIGELSIASVLLFGGVIAFNILLFVVKLDNNVETSYVPEDQSRLYRFRLDLSFVSSLSTAFVAFAFQSGYFPIYNALEVKNYKTGMRFCTYAILFCLLIYTCIIFTGLYNFGVHIEGDVLANVSIVKSWESYVIRFIFLLIMMSHTPFTFFIGKEAVLCLAVLIYNIFKKEKSQDGYKAMVVDDSGDEDSAHTNENENMDRINMTKSFENSKSVSRSKSVEKSQNEDVLKRINTEVAMSMAIPFSRKSAKYSEFVDGGADLDFENAAAHELLPDSIYYPVTLALFFIVVASACAINDVEIVLKFVGSLGNAILNFFIPGLTYFIIMRRYEPETTSNFKLFSALALAIYSGTLALVCTGVNIYTTFNPLE